MNFSSILDISSFFIGIIINLLFVALMCYYFKSKYDNLELAQNEQAKILYDILQKERRSCMMNMCPLPENKVHHVLPFKNNIESDSDSDSDSESDNGTNDDVSVSDIDDLDNPIEDSNMIIVNKLDNDEDVKHLSIQESNDPPEEISFIVSKVEEKPKEMDDYGKLTMKQLKELLSNKGIKTKPNMRKEELIELIQKKESNLEVSSSPNFGSFSCENIEIEGMEEISA